MAEKIKEWQSTIVWGIVLIFFGGMAYKTLEIVDAKTVANAGSIKEVDSKVDDNRERIHKNQLVPMNLTQAVLVAAATELNEVLGLDPAINLTLSRTDLRNKVREAAELVEPSDDLSKETQAVVDDINKDQKEPTAAARTTKADGKDKTDKDKDKGAAKKTGTNKRATKEAAKKKPAYTKAHALRDALKAAGKKGVTRQKIADSLDELYVKKGGKSSPTGSKAMVDIHLPVLVVFGVVEKEDDLFRLTK